MNRRHTLLLLATGLLAAANGAQATPVLTNLSVTGTANALNDAGVTVNIEASDPSGMETAYVYVCAPNYTSGDYGTGGAPFFSFEHGSKSTTMKAAFKIGSTRAYSGFANAAAVGLASFKNRWSMPSDPAATDPMEKWRVCGLSLHAVDGSSTQYLENDPGAEDLTAFPNRVFTLVNKQPDLIAPKALSGTILTSSVSLSNPKPIARVALTVKDVPDPSFSGFAAGIDRIDLYFCLPPVDADGNCSDGFYLVSSFPKPQVNQTSSIVARKVESYVNPGSPPTPGSYVLGTIHLLATAGPEVSRVYVNSQVHTPSNGANLDFTTLFGPATTIAITP